MQNNRIERLDILKHDQSRIVIINNKIQLLKNNEIVIKVYTAYYGPCKICQDPFQRCFCHLPYVA